MMQASSVTNPSRSGLALSPTQQFCEASVIFTPASTASQARPEEDKTSQAPLFAAGPASQVEMTMGLPFTHRFAAEAFREDPKVAPAAPAAVSVMNFLRVSIVYVCNRN